mgnify:CR=1 FL=1
MSRAVGLSSACLAEITVEVALRIGLRDGAGLHAHEEARFCAPGADAFGCAAVQDHQAGVTYGAGVGLVVAVVEHNSVTAADPVDTEAAPGDVLATVLTIPSGLGIYAGTVNADLPIRTSSAFVGDRHAGAHGAGFVVRALPAGAVAAVAAADLTRTIGLADAAAVVKLRARVADVGAAVAVLYTGLIAVAAGRGDLATDADAAIRTHADC